LIFGLNGACHKAKGTGKRYQVPFCSLALTGKPSGFGDAVKRGISSALAVTAAYLLFAFCALFSADPNGLALGGAFGLVSAFGSLIAALMGTFTRLGVNYLFKTVFNPYKEAPGRP